MRCDGCEGGVGVCYDPEDDGLVRGRHRIASGCEYRHIRGYWNINPQR